MIHEHALEIFCFHTNGKFGQDEKNISYQTNQYYGQNQLKRNAIQRSEVKKKKKNAKSH